MSPYALLATITTAPGAESDFPVWVIATWGACLLFAGWVIYVLVREWKVMAAEDEEATARADAEARRNATDKNAA